MKSTIMIIKSTTILIVAATFIASSYEPVQAADNQLRPAVSGEQTDVIQSMKDTVLAAVNAEPGLYNANDVNEFMNDPSGWSSIRYFNQRSFNWRRAAQLAIKNLRWRAKMELSQLDATMFPCDIFKLGLIFEHGTSKQIVDEVSGATVGGSPIIWIRLGALGSIVKHLEKLTARRLVSFAYNSARDVTEKGKNIFRIHRRVSSERPPIIENMSMKNDETIQYVLHAISWWIRDWEQGHSPGTKATLVLDFENTDFAFSSWSMGEFFTGLDDHFPDLFDKILGFRYKAKLWSLHSPISMFNRIFKSRVTSSPETDNKLKFVSNERKLSAYITRVDVDGYSMLPQYIYGDCYGLTEKAPASCQKDNNILLASRLYDPQLMQAIQNEFYQSCKPRNRL